MVSPHSSSNESSMDEKEKKFFNRSIPSHQNPSHSSSSSADESSSSQGTEKVSTSPSNAQPNKSLPNKNNNISTPSKASSSIKRARETEIKEGTKPSSKKSKATNMEEKEKKNSGANKAVGEVEKSAKKGGQLWNAEDEIVFLKGLVACYEKGKGLPKNMSAFYHQIKSELTGEYSNDQLYNKLRGFKAKFGGVRDKVNGKGFSFKNDRDESVYKLCRQVWGSVEEVEDGMEDEKIGEKFEEKVVKTHDTTAAKKKQQHVKEGEGEGEKEERVEKKKQHVKEGEGKKRVEKKQQHVKEGEGKERAEKKKRHVKEGEVKERLEKKKQQHGKEGEGEERVEKKKKQHVKEGEGEESVEKKKKRHVKEGELEEREEVKRKKHAKDGEEEEREEVKRKKHVKDGEGEEREEKKRKKHVKDGEGKERGKVKRNAGEDLEMSQKEQEDDEGDANGNVNLAPDQLITKGNQAACYVSESMPNRVGAGEKSEEDVGEEEDSSEEDVGEEENSSEEEDEGESSGTLNGSRRVEISDHHNSRENPTSMRHVSYGISNESRKIAATDLHNAMEVLTMPDASNGTSNGSKRIAANDRQKRVSATDQQDTGRNWTGHDSNAMENENGSFAIADQQNLVDQLSKESVKMMIEFRNQVHCEIQDLIAELKHEITETVKAELQGSSNTRTNANLEFPSNSMINRVPSARELPALSNSEVEMLDQKWQTQQLVEMEASSKHLALLQQECRLRLAKLQNN